MDQFLTESDELSPASKLARSKVLSSGLIFNEERYEYSDEFVPANTDNPLEIHTTSELLECLLKNRDNPAVEIEANVLGLSTDGRSRAKLNKEQFIEACLKKSNISLREAYDGFNGDEASPYYSQGTIGQDFTPLLGGPFNKQLYYRDYLRMISTCFFAYHHDPIARDLVSIMTDFTMGRGFEVHATGRDAEKAQILWDAFSVANRLDEQMDYAATELSIYGENMFWWLPNNQARISFMPVAGERVPKALIPRVRLIDPSNIAEIVTIPEDPILGVLYYVWMAPTQYQMWTDGHQPATKFIYSQLPADQVMHFKVNSVSNEKRGRSDYFPALGYMKRLRDSVNYSLVKDQKNAAWSIDTTIEGNQDDLDAYVASQQALGTIAPAGSEFVHTASVKREYLANNAGKSGGSDTFQWCLSMICMASGIPLSYLGTHLTGAANRASALVSTEPVAKRFERRRKVYQRIIQAMFERLMKEFNLSADCDILFPELITQDRSAKLKDLMLAQQSRWLSPKRAAEIAAKELDIKNYDYEQEQLDSGTQDDGLADEQISPLTAPPKEPQNKAQGLAAPEREQIKKTLGTL